MITLLAALIQSTSPAYDAAQISWLNGCWEGEGLGGKVQECWLTGGDGRMSGVFHFETAEGVQGFSEMMWIGEFPDGPALRLKHFSNDLSGWEARDETVDFAFRRADQTGVHFEGLSYLREGEDAITVSLAQEEGEPLVFSYRRAQ